MIKGLKQNHLLWYQGPMILWAIALFTQSSIPGDRIPDLAIFTHDKLIHCLIYVIFAFSVHRAIRYQTRFPLLLKHPYFFTFLIIALYGASDEFHQYFVPMRSCSLYDWLADCFGAVLLIGYHWVRRKLKPEVVSA